MRKEIITVALLSCLLIILAPLNPGASSIDEKIADLNRMIEKKGYHWKAGITSMSHLSDEQMKNYTGLIPTPPSITRDIPLFENTPMPVDDDYFNWQDLNGVTSVKDQGACGSCWAFATLAQVESFVRIYDHRYEDLSEQQLIDCGPGNCTSGGTLPSAYTILEDYGSVDEADIPYKEDDIFPCTQADYTPRARIEGYNRLSNSVAAIKSALQTGPVATVMYASSVAFRNYSSGCFDTDFENDADHAVLILGWDDSACGGDGAWICKNSWGEGWGMEGFFMIEYGCCSIGEVESYQIQYAPAVQLTGSVPSGTLYGGDEITLSWETGNYGPYDIDITLFDNTNKIRYFTIADDTTGINSITWELPSEVITDASIVIEAFSQNSDSWGKDEIENLSITFRSQVLNNAPNPFTESTSITYSVSSSSRVELIIYSPDGRIVRRISRDVQPGEYTLEWNGMDDSGSFVTPGLYLCRIKGDGFEETRKIIYLK